MAIIAKRANGRVREDDMRVECVLGLNAGRDPYSLAGFGPATFSLKFVFLGMH
jgi:hypothetical protein